jgi:two-component system, NtrC family, sensor kinase
MQNDNNRNESVSQVEVLSNNCPPRQELNEELEARVEERTAELNRMVVDLKEEIKKRIEIENKLRSSEQFLQLAMDSIPQLIFWKDRNSLYLGCNQKFASIAGVALPENIIGKSDYDLPWKKEETEWFRECDRRVMESGVAELHIIEPQKTADGKEGWVDTNKIPLRDAQGNVVGILGTAEDISDDKLVEIQLKQPAEDLQNTLQELQRTQMQLIQSEKMSGLGQLIAGVAHEINNPVNFIFGNLIFANNYIEDLLRLVQLYEQHYGDRVPEIQELAKDIDLNFLIEDLRKLLKSMKIGAERIREIVLSLRTFSRMDEAEMKKVDIHEGLDSTLMILGHRIKAKPGCIAIEVIKEYGNLPLVECYAGQLNQVFMNILANAIDALDESLVNESEKLTNPQIRICTELLEGDRVKISIADNGLGIPSAVKTRLFDPFFTTKAIGKGTGMGLSISYQIISDRHGGSLECISQPGAGAEFVIVIPLCQG